MARKKKSAQSDAATDGSTSSTPQSTPQKKSATEPSTSALIICRNKHWRYISSFHGPWLQLPPEVLESLAHSNYFSPRPHQIDPAVFYDIVKIRKAVDEATDLAVRATSGLTSAALNNSLHAGNSIMASAAALGIGYGSAATGKLSRERKHRMRELATSKLSQAYHLDEIATSVATMQSASTLEDVAMLVLQRNPMDFDAKYVHFFHEKIPSRMTAEFTPLDNLNHMIGERPHDASPLRTRALTRIFKDDFVNSAKDLSEALVLTRYHLAQHGAGKDQLVLAEPLQEQYGRDWRQEAKIPEEDQPSSLETQLLFHRAGVYFTIACSHLPAALEGSREAEATKARREAHVVASLEPEPESPDEAAANHGRAEARKQVRQNAKRALRDYTAFLSHFDYTPGMSPAIAEEFLRRLGAPTNGNGNGNPPNRMKPDMGHLLDSSDPSSSPISEALVPHRGLDAQPADKVLWAKLPPPAIFKVSQLFDSAPPTSLPPFPPLPPNTTTESAASAAVSAFADAHESITYHPLLTDALHSLLLCHALIQTPSKEHLRHAHNAARLARLCDGYPIFLAARSPARADWIEILRRAGNWIGLGTSWEQLCRPAPLPGYGKNNTSKEIVRNGNGSLKTTNETEAQERERQKHEAILEALADERVVDEATFQRAVRARERRFMEDDKADKHTTSLSLPPPTPSPASNPSLTTSSTSSRAHDRPTPRPNLPKPTGPTAYDPTPKRWAQDDGREYPISTERAEAISRWIKEAPKVLEGVGPKKRRAKGKGKKVGLPRGGTGLSLAESVETLALSGEEEVD